MPSWLITWKYKLALYGAVIVGILVFLLKVFLAGRNSGQQSLRQELQARKDKVETKWNKIDSTPMSVDTAVGKLQDRARAAGYPSDPPANPSKSDINFSTDLY